ERALPVAQVARDRAEVPHRLLHVAERARGALVEGRVVQQEPERPGAAVELAGDRGEVLRRVAERVAVLLDDVREVREESLRVRPEALREVAHVLGDAGELVDGVAEARRGLAVDRVAGLRGLRRRRAERDRDEALAAEGPEVEPGDRVLLHLEAAVDLHLDAHVPLLDREPVDPTGLQPRETDGGADVEPLDVGKVRVDRVAALQDAEAERELDGDQEEHDPDDEEDADFLFPAEHQSSPCSTSAAARMNSRVSGWRLRTSSSGVTYSAIRPASSTATRSAMPPPSGRLCVTMICVVPRVWRIRAIRRPISSVRIGSRSAVGSS